MKFGETQLQLRIQGTGATQSRSEIVFMFRFIDFSLTSCVSIAPAPISVYFHPLLIDLHPLLEISR